ncbi:MAG: hypothetical protein M3297_13030 [Thermoproteota archaeon]|nr:hypothetical protein [Thermoproteota archaeon]
MSKDDMQELVNLSERDSLPEVSTDSIMEQASEDVNKAISDAEANL